jgi:uncharacterized protein
LSVWSSYGVPVRDTLMNLLTGLGTAKDPRTASRFVFRELNRRQLENMYRGDWLARRIVDLPAEDATREWRTWQADPDKIDAIEELEKKFELQRKTRQAIQRARLYGGAALVIGVDQGQPDEELDYDKVGKDDLKFVVVLNRYELTAGPRIYDVDSPYYTRPSYYQVATPISGFYGEGGMNGAASPTAYQAGAPSPFPPDRSLQMTPVSGPIYIHPSRVLEFVGNEMPDWRLIPMGGGWGDSILQTVDDSLHDFAMIVGGLASVINDMKMDVVKVPELSRKLSTPELSAKTLQRFSLSNSAKSTINALLLDKDEDWERIQTSFGSTPELIRVAMTLACAAGGVPESRIMGNAPNKGLAKAGASGGEVDIKNYYDDIASQQRTKYKPALSPLDICLQRSALGSFDHRIDYEWRPLYQPDPGAVAQTNLQKAQATQVYVGLGLINEDAMRDAVISQLDEDGVYPGLQDAIDEHGAEPDEPPAPPPGAMPGAPGGMPPLHADPRQQVGAAKPGQPAPLPKPAPGLQQAKDFDPEQPRDPHGGEGVSVPGNTSGDGRDS